MIKRERKILKENKKGKEKKGRENTDEGKG